MKRENPAGPAGVQPSPDALEGAPGEGSHDDVNCAEDTAADTAGNGYASIKFCINGETMGLFERPFQREDMLINKQQMALLKEVQDVNVELDLHAKLEWFHKGRFTLLQEEGDKEEGYELEDQVRLELLARRFEHFIQQCAKDERLDEARRLLADAHVEVELSKLSTVDPSAVKLDDMERLVQHEEFFRRLKEAYYGTGAMHEVSVYFKDVSLVARSPNPEVAFAFMRFTRATVWSSSLKLFIGWLTSPISLMRARLRGIPLQVDRLVLDRCSGVLRPGRLTLVLGPPGAGKTTLMRTLMGFIKTEPGKQEVKGSIYYNANKESDIHTPNFANYVNQIDNHIPILTTEETLQFAHDCKKGDVDAAVLAGALSKEQAEHAKMLQKAQVRFVLAVLGLARAAKTIIGNEVMKGVSGGEKRRVTLGEMLAGGDNCQVLYLDEISTGLDAAATFDITKALKSAARMLRITPVVALLQPPPETFDLFDDVLLVDSGRIVYLGPREDVVPHFEKLGFEKPPGLDVGDWLQEVTTKDGPKYKKAGATVMVPLTTDEFVAAFQQTARGQAMMAELEAEPAEHASDHWNEKLIASTKKFAVSWVTSTKLLVKRQGTVVLRNKAFLLARVVQNVVFGLLLGMLMFQLNFEEYYVKAMLMFEFIAFVSFSATAQLNDIIESRNVYYKQSKMSFYPASAYVVADMLVSAPLHFFDCIVLGTIVYFMCGLTLASAGAHFFIYIVINFSFALAVGQIVRAIGYASPTEDSAYALSVLAVVLMLFFSGGVATFDVIPVYWVWMYWISPIAWAYRSLQQNEYLSDDYTQGDGCCIDSSETCTCDPCTAFGQSSLNCGQYFLKSRQFQTEEFFLWTGVAFTWGVIVIMFFLSVLALIYIRHDEARGRTPMEPTKIESESHIEVAIPAEPSQSEVAIPFEQCELVFRDVVYTLMLPGAPDQHGKKTLQPVDLLKGVSGYVKPYKMTALMGSSGAGKTTLLDVLAGRKTQGEIKGDFIVNGRRKVKGEFVKQLAYVEQFGVHCPVASVYESLLFSAELRLDATTTTAKQRQQFVEDQLELLELNVIRDKLVGIRDKPDSLSFEEIKRLTIGVELVANPSILFLDEPTSGLDARGASIVMGGLKKITASGRALVCTIHQPSLTVFSMFDDLLLMRRGGSVVFFGELGSGAQNLVAYFEALNGKGCPNGLNPATWMLDVIGAGMDGGKQGLDFAHEYELSALNMKNMAIINNAVSTVTIELEDEAREKALSTQAVPTSKQFALVTKRMFTEYWRSPGYTHLRSLVTGLFAIVLGSIFWQLEVKVAADVESMIALLNLHLTILGQANAMTVIPFMYTRKALYYREKACGMYTPLLYVLAAALVEIPYVFVEVAVSVNVLYWMVGLSDEMWRFWYFWLVSLIFTLPMTFLGQLFSQLAPDGSSGTLFVVLYLQLSGLFAGTTVPGAEIPSYLIWLSYISPFRWATEGLVTTQFQANDTPICVPIGEVIDVEAETCTNNGTFTTAGQYVLGDPKAGTGLFGGTNGFSYSFRWYDVTFLLGFWLVIHLSQALAAGRINYEKR